MGKYAYNAPKVLDSSHTILFCTKADISEQHLENLLHQDDLHGRFKDDAAKQGQKTVVQVMSTITAMKKVMCSVGPKTKPLLL